MKHLKYILLIAALFFINTDCNAQDIIYLKSGEKIETKIIEISQEDLKYKLFKNLEGPIRVINKSDIQLLIYANGETEIFDKVTENKKIRSKNAKLAKSSTVYLEYKNTDGKKNVDGDDAKGMLRTYIEGKTFLVVVDIKEEADFTIELRVIKSAGRKAQIKIINLFSNKEIYVSKWRKGSSSVYNGYSGTRGAIGEVVKKELVKDIPSIKK